MGDIHVAAKPAELNLNMSDCKTLGLGLADCSLKGQVDRWGSRPLVATNQDLSKFGSLKGRGICLLQVGYTLVREVYRGFKNVLVIFERTFNLIRKFFECLFQENNSSWGDLGERCKQLLGATAALFVRPLTFALDILKLSTGVLVPSAAIRS